MPPGSVLIRVPTGLHVSEWCSGVYLPKVGPHCDISFSKMGGDSDQCTVVYNTQSLVWEVQSRGVAVCSVHMSLSGRDEDKGEGGSGSEGVLPWDQHATVEKEKGKDATVSDAASVILLAPPDTALHIMSVKHKEWVSECVQQQQQQQQRGDSTCVSGAQQSPTDTAPQVRASVK